MTDRERLIELIRKAKKNTKGANCDLEREMLFADYLLSNGVIVPPCKVGDMVYIPWHWDGQQGVSSAKVEEINIYDNKNHFMFLIDLQSDDEEYSQKYDGWKIDKSIGETVFLTPEEAEKALAERQGKNEKP